MIKVRLDEIVKKSGKSYYRLAKQSGISYNTLWRLKNGKAKGINFDTLEGICRSLNCTPNDVLVLSEFKGKTDRH